MSNHPIDNTPFAWSIICGLHVTNKRNQNFVIAYEDFKEEGRKYRFYFKLRRTATETQEIIQIKVVKI